MTVLPTHLSGLILIQPDVFADDRGYFLESFSQQKYRALGIEADFVQDNESCSQKNVLRGLHFQMPPHAQDKLVRVIQGAVWDVAVDLRKGSPTYGQYEGVRLDAVSKQQFFIPKGFAHGFLTLEDNTIFAYKCTDFYHKESEGSLRWDDADLAIAWPVDQPQLSAKDLVAPVFSTFLTPFV